VHNEVDSRPSRAGTRGWWLAAALALLSAAALLFGAGAAHANGVPQRIRLAYLDGVSNWGPKDAEGVVSLSFAEAYARIDVSRLVAEPGFVYEAWLVNPAGNALFVGALTVDGSGVGGAEAKINGLERYDYDLFVITARSATTPAGTLPNEKSIAGRFAPPQDTPVSQGAGDQQQNQSGNVPRVLPETGERPAGDGSPFANPRFLAAGALAAGGLAIFGLRQRALRRRPR
jgi:hypothetical protein